MRAKKKKAPGDKSRVMSKKTKKKDSSPVAAHSSRGNVVTIKGTVDGDRVPSRILEEQIQQAVREGAQELHIVAQGQHGIGGRIWPTGRDGKDNR